MSKQDRHLCKNKNGANYRLSEQKDEKKISKSYVLVLVGIAFVNPGGFDPLTSGYEPRSNTN